MSRDGATKQPPRNGFAALNNFIPLVPFYIPENIILNSIAPEIIRKPMVF